VSDFVLAMVRSHLFESASVPVADEFRAQAAEPAKLVEDIASIIKTAVIAFIGNPFLPLFSEGRASQATGNGS
jgi:hypothetical protein